MTTKTLDKKLANILADPSCSDFILADAKDADMAFGIAAPSRNREKNRWRTLQEFRELIRQNVEQGLIDIMLMSASTSEVLTINERLFKNSSVTPAIRANDTTDIWLARGGIYSKQPALPFRSASLVHAMGTNSEDPSAVKRGADLGLYSVTFNNDPALDTQTLDAYSEFCREAEQKEFRHFLEVFDPNSPTHPIADVGAFVNDHIVRMLAGVAERRRPMFLKMVYHGPASLEELVSYDSSLVVGILGGSSGTTFDAFHQLWEAKKYGARVALYGRMINNAEHQLTFIQHLRYLADGEISDPAEAVRSYHGQLQHLGIRPTRTLEDDLQASKRYFDYSAKPQPTTAGKPSPQSKTQNLSPDVVVAGHICLDVIPTFPELISKPQTSIEPGQLREVGPAAYMTGGCVANTGLALHHLGISTSLMGKLGDDPFGKQLLKLISGADATLAEGMIVAPDENTSYSMVISPPGIDRSFLHFPGANNTFSAVDINLAQINAAKIFHFGYPPLMRRFWKDGGAEMAMLLRSVKELGTMTSLDMAMPDPAAAAGKIDWVAWLKLVLPHVDLFLPSLEEISFMLNQRHFYGQVNNAGEKQSVAIDADYLSETADLLIELGATIVVLKLGSSGLYMKTSTELSRIFRSFYQRQTGIEQWVGRELYSPCFEIQVASTNGAGDRTIAGFLAALVRDAHPSTAMETAVAVGAASVECLAPGKNMVSLETLDERILGGWKRKQVEVSFQDQFSLGECGCWRGKHDQLSNKSLSSV
jgi:sugar/nucleoside kinase (ribokinase family)